MRADKVAFIHDMAFPSNLKGLESGIDFFGYYQKLTEHYAKIVSPLSVLKIMKVRPGRVVGSSMVICSRLHCRTFQRALQRSKEAAGSLEINASGKLVKGSARFNVKSIIILLLWAPRRHKKYQYMIQFDIRLNTGVQVHEQWQMHMIIINRE